MNRYPIRAIKYLIYVSVLIFLIFGVFYLIDKNSMEFDKLMSERGYIMLGVVVLLAIAYPFMGYVKKTLIFDVNKRSEDVDGVMKMCGYSKVVNTPELKTYRVNSALKKLNLMFEDEITIATKDDVSIMSGPRKEVVKVYFRMGTYIRDEDK